jgi:hypothetical protein
MPSPQQVTQYDNAMHEARLALLKAITERVGRASLDTTTMKAMAEAYAKVVCPSA